MTKPPPVNPNIDEIADQAKYAFAAGTRALSETQHRLAELAGLGFLDRDESMRLQRNLIEVWDHLYYGILEAIFGDHNTYAGDNTYSDGRTVRILMEFDSEQEENWEYNPFLLEGGAVVEQPRGTIFHIAPVNAADDVDDEPEIVTKLRGLNGAG